jgi:hypothetical protein
MTRAVQRSNNIEPTDFHSRLHESCASRSGSSSSNLFKMVVMAEVIPNPKKIHCFKSAMEFEGWMRINHDRASELWLKVHKKDSGKQTVTVKAVLDVALC